MSQDDDLQSFREELRTGLEKLLPVERREPRFGGLLGARREAMLWWQAQLNSKGWGAPGWPVDHGGCGWSSEKLRVFHEENARLGAPAIHPQGVVMVGPVIYTFGSPEQRQRHLPPLLKGETLWCQGYSEPGSGSDLASLKTRAIRDGDHYVVNGQKTWCTFAHFADWMFCLVRTDPDAKKQRGISFLLIDMKTPGVEVRPIKSIDGEDHLNEVFFTNARVPVENLIGEENQGWTYAKFLLVNERAGAASVAGTRYNLARAKAHASDSAFYARPPIEDPEIAAAFQSLERRLDALDALEERALTAPEQSREAATLGAPLKLLGTELSQDVTELSTMVAGPGALATSEGRTISAYGAFGEEELTGFLFSRAESIYGGTNEVQKNIIAQMMVKQG